MKKYFTYTLSLLIIISALAGGCKKDEPLDGPPPTSSDIVTAITADAGSDISFTGTIMDEVGLTSVKIEYMDWSLAKTIDLADNPKSYLLDYTFTVPASATPGDHTVVITASNLPEKAATFNVVVTVNEPPSFENVYATGGFGWWGYNAEHGYMMLQDPANEDWFEILVHAWSDDGWYEIKFIGQLAWTPDNWGLVDQTNPSLGMTNSEDSEAILLDAPSSIYYPSYWKVRFNPYEMTYTTEEVDQAGFVAQDNMYIVGSGFTDYPLLDWNPEQAILMDNNDVHYYGEHIFVKENLTFSEAVSLKFIGQNDGWSPVDVGFDETYLVDADATTDGWQTLEPVTWLPTKSGDGTADLKFVDQAGLYTVLYDHFAKRALIWKE